MEADGSPAIIWEKQLRISNKVLSSERVGALVET
jgi:hypothetical protein